ncbi:MAG: hypothetical protein IPI61_03650 [Syntrophaceae bacterium]|nr:hypothetical protein [Syntrophaceae bacterium]
MRNQGVAVRVRPKRMDLVLGRGPGRPAVEELHAPGTGMLWGFLISVVLWLALGGLWAALA